jgi:phosphoribosyl isomerase A
MAELELLPAVDVAAGQAVQLVQGVADTGGQFGDPIEAALRWQASGCRWIHLVDLDAAFGRGTNAPLLAEIVTTVDVNVELSGGIRNDRTLDAALATGCARINIGTAALEDPDWCARAIERHGDKVAVGLDVRGRTLSARGWTHDLGDLFEALERLDAAGCRRYVVTDIDRDGLLQGPNLDLLRTVCARTSAPVVASGGVTSLADISALARLTSVGVEGAIIGTALYSGDLRLEDALAAAKAASRPDPLAEQSTTQC